MGVNFVLLFYIF